MLPWNEKVPMFSIYPDAANRDDVAKLATELMKANKRITELEDKISFAITAIQTGQNHSCPLCKDYLLEALEALVNI